LLVKKDGFSNIAHHPAAARQHNGVDTIGFYSLSGVSMNINSILPPSISFNVFIDYNDDFFAENLTKPERIAPLRQS
jgi:hypothetical protein